MLNVESRLIAIVIMLLIDPTPAVKSWNQASFSWIERHTEGGGTMMLRHMNVK